MLRKVDWGGFGPDFGLIVDAHALDGAALRNIALAKMSKPQEAALTRALGTAFPAVNVISAQAPSWMPPAPCSTSWRWRSAARQRWRPWPGLLVLAGSIAAGALPGRREAATLKVLGAARAADRRSSSVGYGAVG